MAEIVLPRVNTRNGKLVRSNSDAARIMCHWFIGRVERLVRRGGPERWLASLRCGTTIFDASAPLSPHEISNGLSEEVLFLQRGVK